MKSCTACLAVGLSMAVPLSFVGAQTLEATYLATDPSLDVVGVVDGDLLVDGPAGLVSFDVFAGFSITPVPAFVPGETIVYSIQDPATLEEIDAIGRIVGGYQLSTRSDLDAAAAQWAIWEVLGDGTAEPSFGSGMVRLYDPGSEVAVRALEYLENLDGLPVAELGYLTHPSRQDLVVTVPEVGTTTMIGVALAAFAVRRRRGDARRSASQSV